MSTSIRTAFGSSLRPFPRTYRRPLYGRAIRINASIYIAKSDGHHVMNPTASPILTEAEAKWLTSELKRVLLSTGRSVPS